MLILGLKDPFSKERLMEREQSLEKTSHHSNKQAAHEELKKIG